MHLPRPTRLLTGLSLVVCLSAPAAVGLAEDGLLAPLPSLGYGITVDADGPDAAPWRDPALGDDHALLVRIVASWSDLEPEAGRLELDRLHERIRGHRAAGARILLCLTGGNPAVRPGGGPPTAADRPYLNAWLGFVRAVSESVRGEVDLFQVWDRPDEAAGWGAAPSARDYAFLVKSTAVTIRSVLPWAWVSQGALARAGTAFQADLFGLEVAPYVDGIALAGAPSAVSAADRDALRALILEHDAASPLWFAEIPLPGGGAPGARALAAELLAAAGHGARMALFRMGPAADPAVRPGPAATLLDLHRRWAPTVDRLVGTPGRGAARFRREGGELDVAFEAFFDGEAFRVVLLYQPRPGTPPGTAEVVLDTSDVGRPLLVDLESGEETEPGLYIPDRQTDTTRMDVPLGPGPRLLVYERFVSDALRRAPEELEVEEAAQATAEEIMTRHQAFQAAQDAKLTAYVAQARVDLHFAFGTGGSLDVTYDNRFLFDREVGAEWEQQALYVNGTRWRGGKIPELPLIQPDKIVILPLDLHLDKSYRYRLDGTEVVDGYLTWRIGFEPEDRGSGLYSGKVWIDQRTHARVQMAVRQRGKEPPFISNDEVDHYRPILGPDGTEHWLLTSLTSSQLYTTSGRNFAVNRKVVFSAFRINPEDFAAVREEAYRSTHPMLRDTDQGYRYLARTGDGGRTVEEDVSRNQAFWLGGVFFNEAQEFVVPFAGINYFDFDFRGTGAQLNGFFAGALLTGSLTDPSLFGSPLEAGVSVFGVAVDSTDRFFQDGTEIEERNVDRKTQWMQPFLALSFAKFWKARLSYRLAWDLFSRDGDTQEDFLTPVDHLVHEVGVDVEYNRRAWSLRLRGRGARRDEWEPWGAPEDRAAFDSTTEEYGWWDAWIAKEIYLPYFQKLRFEGIYMDSDDLDRFSQFQFGFFGGTRLRGFSGSGLRFDRGGIVRGQYSFDVMEVIRFDFNLDHARVRDPFAARDDGGDPQPAYLDHTGVGIAGNFMGPWGSILNFDLGVAVRSDVEKVEGEVEFQFLVLKLF